MQAAIPSGSGSGSRVGTMIWAWGGAISRVAVFASGETPGSEFGGEPNPSVRVFIKDPQLIVPGSESEGGV
jgi:hypothetical protein